MSEVLSLNRSGSPSGMQFMPQNPQRAKMMVPPPQHAMPGKSMMMVPQMGSSNVLAVAPGGRQPPPARPPPPGQAWSAPMPMNAVGKKMAPPPLTPGALANSGMMPVMPQFNSNVSNSNNNINAAPGEVSSSRSPSPQSSVAWAPSKAMMKKVMLPRNSLTSGGPVPPPSGQGPLVPPGAKKMMMPPPNMGPAAPQQNATPRKKSPFSFLRIGSDSDDDSHSHSQQQRLSVSPQPMSTPRRSGSQQLSVVSVGAVPFPKMAMPPPSGMPMKKWVGPPPPSMGPGSQSYPSPPVAMAAAKSPSSVSQHSVPPSAMRGKKIMMTGPPPPGAMKMMMGGKVPVKMPPPAVRTMPAPAPAPLASTATPPPQPHPNQQTRNASAPSTSEATLSVPIAAPVNRAPRDAAGEVRVPDSTVLRADQPVAGLTKPTSRPIIKSGRFGHLALGGSSEDSDDEEELVIRNGSIDGGSPETPAADGTALSSGVVKVAVNADSHSAAEVREGSPATPMDDRHTRSPAGENDTVAFNSPIPLDLEPESSAVRGDKKEEGSNKTAPKPAPLDSTTWVKKAADANNTSNASAVKKVGGAPPSPRTPTTAKLPPPAATRASTLRQQKAARTPTAAGKSTPERETAVIAKKRPSSASKRRDSPGHRRQPTPKSSTATPLSTLRPLAKRDGGSRSKPTRAERSASASSRSSKSNLSASTLADRSGTGSTLSSVMHRTSSANSSKKEPRRTDKGRPSTPTRRKGRRSASAGGRRSRSSSRRRSRSPRSPAAVPTVDLYRLHSLLSRLEEEERQGRKSSRRRQRGATLNSRRARSADGPSSKDDDDKFLSDDGWDRRRSFHEPYAARVRQSSGRPRASVGSPGIPWRFSSPRVADGTFGNPSPVRRPLGYINIGGGRYARIGGSPYAQRATTMHSGRIGGGTSPCGRNGRMPTPPRMAEASAISSDYYNCRNPDSMRLDADTSGVVEARTHAVVRSLQRDYPARVSPARYRSPGFSAAVDCSTASDTGHPYSLSTPPPYLHVSAGHSPFAGPRGRTASTKGGSEGAEEDAKQPSSHQAKNSPSKALDDYLRMSRAAEGAGGSPARDTSPLRTAPFFNHLFHEHLYSGTDRPRSEPSLSEGRRLMSPHKGDYGSQPLIFRPRAGSADGSDVPRKPSSLLGRRNSLPAVPKPIMSPGASRRSSTAAAGSRVSPVPDTQSKKNPNVLSTAMRTQSAPSKFRAATAARLARGGGGGRSQQQQQPSGGAEFRQSGKIQYNACIGGSCMPSQAQSCKAWLDDVFSSINEMSVHSASNTNNNNNNVTSSPPRARVSPSSRQPLRAPIATVDLRSSFKPMTTENTDLEAFGAEVSRRNAADAAPRASTIKFAHMTGVRSARSTHTAASGGSRHGSAKQRAVVEVNAPDGLPYEQYSTFQTNRPSRPSPWALGPSRDTVCVRPGAVAARRRVSLEAEGNDKQDSALVQEVRLDERGQPYVVLKAIPTGAAAKAQKDTTQRLAKPKPIFVRSSDALP